MRYCNFKIHMVGWVGGWPVREENNATSWNYLARWGLPDFQSRWNFKIKPNVVIICIFINYIICIDLHFGLCIVIYALNHMHFSHVFYSMHYIPYIGCIMFQSWYSILCTVFYDIHHRPCIVFYAWYSMHLFYALNLL